MRLNSRLLMEMESRGFRNLEYFAGAGVNLPENAKPKKKQQWLRTGGSSCSIQAPCSDSERLAALDRLSKHAFDPCLPDRNEMPQGCMDE